jgi:hypothetical protein
LRQIIDGVQFRSGSTADLREQHLVAADLPVDLARHYSQLPGKPVWGSARETGSNPDSFDIALDQFEQG